MRKIRKMDEMDRICSAARLLDMRIEPGDLEKIAGAVGCTKKLAEKISEKMTIQKDFMDYLAEMDRKFSA